MNLTIRCHNRIMNNVCRKSDHQPITGYSRCCIHTLTTQCVRLCPEMDFERWLAPRCLILLKSKERKGHKTILHLRCQKRCQQTHVAIFY